MKKVIAIHQPNYLPWMGYFRKMMLADQFVFLDSVEISNDTSYVNSCFIKTTTGPFRLTVPLVHAAKIEISKQEIHLSSWKKKHLSTIYHSYHYAEFFKPVYKLLAETFDLSTKNLTELNIRLINNVLSFLQLEVSCSRSSEINVKAMNASARIIEICKQCQASIYLSGAGGRKYHDTKLFSAANIEIRYSDFIEAERKQFDEPFLQGLSIIDCLFHYGEKAKEFLKGE